jgi:hypothetical protein
MMGWTSGSDGEKGYIENSVRETSWRKKSFIRLRIT